jgi:hypothetical protein
MIESRHAAIPTHLPWFVTEPGQSDMPVLLTGLFSHVVLACANEV